MSSNTMCHMRSGTMCNTGSLCKSALRCWIKWEPQIGCVAFTILACTRERYWGTSFLHLTSVDHRNSGSEKTLQVFIPLSTAGMRPLLGWVHLARSATATCGGILVTNVKSGCNKKNDCMPVAKRHKSITGSCCNLL
jgi:hypothetical protein